MKYITTIQTIIINILIIIILVLVIQNMTINTLDKQTIEEVYEFFELNHPVNSSADSLIKIMKENDASCQYIPLLSPEEEQEYKQLVMCAHSKGTFSHKPSVEYTVMIYIGEKDKIKKLELSQFHCSP